MREWALARNLWKRRPPAFFHGSPRILSRFRLLPKIAQHWINRPLQHEVALPDRFLHSLPFSIAAQPLELVVRIENHDRPWETPGRARTVRVHPNHIKRVTADAERKMRIARIGGDLRVPVEMTGILGMEEAQLSPETLFEFEFGEMPGPLEDGNERRVFAVRAAGEVTQRRGQLFRRSGAPELVEGTDKMRIRIERGLGAEAGEVRAQHEFAERSVSLFRKRTASQRCWIRTHCVFTRDTHTARLPDAENGSRLFFTLVEID